MEWKSWACRIGVWIFPLSIALPLPLMVKSIALALFCISLLNAPYVKRFGHISRSQIKIIIIFALIYFSDPLLGLFRGDEFYFEDTRLPFLILPIVLTHNLNFFLKERRNIENAFLLGVGVYIIYAILYLLYFYGTDQTNATLGFNYYLKYVLYEYLPWNIHHTYLSIYLIYAGVLIGVRRNLQWYWRLSATLLIFLLLPIFGSKWSIVVALIVMFFVGFKLYRKKFFLLAIPFMGFALIFISWIAQHTDLFRTIKNSMKQRIELYQCAIEGFSEYFLWGIGKNEIKSWMRECSASNLRMDTHNIFLQELVGSGIFAVLLLVYLFAILFRAANQDSHFMAFVLLILLFGIVEHLFNTQMGVTFFVFFALMHISSHMLNSSEQNSSL